MSVDVYKNLNVCSRLIRSRYKNKICSKAFLDIAKKFFCIFDIIIISIITIIIIIIIITVLVLLDYMSLSRKKITFAVLKSLLSLPLKFV